MLIEKFAPGLADWLYQKPHWGIVASATGFGASFLTLLADASIIVGFAGAVFGCIAGYYTFRIKRSHWKKLQHKTMTTKIKLLLTYACLCLSLSGCGVFSALVPKDVEFAQDKVKAVPVQTDAAQERQRQAAQYINQKAQEAETAAAETQVDPKVAGPLKELHVVATGLTISLGPPSSPYHDWFSSQPDTVARDLATKLQSDVAKLNSKIDDFRKSTQKDVGKKIEGTGLIKMGYFTYLGCIIGLILLVWLAVKIYGMINPAVGLGSSVIGAVGSKVVSKAFSEVVAGGEAFKQYIDNSPLTDDVKNYVKSLFVQAHTSNQSADIQSLVDKLTNSAAIKVPTIVQPPASLSAPLTPAIPVPELPQPTLPLVVPTLKP